MPSPDTGRITLRPRTMKVVHTAAICLMTAASVSTFAMPLVAHVPVLDFGDWQTYAGIAILWWSAFVSGAALLHQSDTKAAVRNTAATVAVMVRSNATKQELSELRELLESLCYQYEPPKAVVLVENGAPHGEYIEMLFTWWKRHPMSSAIADKQYLYCPEPSKQAALMMASRWADRGAVIVTVDSYTICDAAAVKEILGAFADPSLVAATGLLVGRRSQRHVLARTADLLFTASYQERAAWSTFDALSSTRGGFAAYRNYLLQECQARFLAGEKTGIGDDRALTDAAHRHGGKVVFVPSAIAYTRHPVTLRDLSGRYRRWGQSYRRGAVGLLAHPPARRAVWWLTAAQLAVHLLQGVAYPAALVSEILVTGRPPWVTLAFVGAITACRTASTLGVKHASQSLPSQVASFVLLLPLAVALDIWLCVTQMWGGMLRRRRIEWQPWHVEAPPRTMSVR